MHLNFLFIDFSAIDKPTVIAVLAGQVVVILILFLLYRLYKRIPDILHLIRKQDEQSKVPVSYKKNQANGNDDVNAAIAMALYLHFNKTDAEAKNTITIRRPANSYSPWCSKALSMRNLR
ncbi:MAG TPA: hypothetical protein PLR88_07530 [Bacteroidales bacterium]|nr:hypothetical protein [Bacteroidales bacterium]HPT21782.1 hypothetical protein [Bacteroidales bacterium]